MRSKPGTAATASGQKSQPSAETPVMPPQVRAKTSGRTSMAMSQRAPSARAATRCSSASIAARVSGRL